MISEERQKELVRIAQEEAAKAVEESNAPFGAVLTNENGELIARAHNTQTSSNDPTAHAEINLLRKTGKIMKSKYLEGLHQFGNAEPCSMCMSASIKAKIRHFYYGASAEKSMDPWLPVEEVASKSKQKLFIVANILKEECEGQIADARKTLQKRQND